MTLSVYDLMPEGTHKVLREICNVALQWYRYNGTGVFKVLVNPEDGFNEGGYNFGLGFITTIRHSHDVAKGEMFFMLKKKELTK